MAKWLNVQGAANETDTMVLCSSVTAISVEKRDLDYVLTVYTVPVNFVLPYPTITEALQMKKNILEQIDGEIAGDTKD